MTPQCPVPFAAFTTPEFWSDPHIFAQVRVNRFNPDNPLPSLMNNFDVASVAYDETAETLAVFVACA